MMGNTGPEREPNGPAANRDLAARLDRWAALSPRQTNTGVVAFTALMMMCLLGGTWGMPDQAAFLRRVDMAFMSLHGVLHVLIVRILSRLKDGGVAAAGRALQAYRAPNRVTNLDLLIGWAGFALLVSVMIRLYAPG